MRSSVALPTCALALASACASGPKPAPEWFSRPPPADARHLWFAGDATGAGEPGLARDLAVQKALAALTQYCGAIVTSDFESFERESNGELEQTVSLTVDVAGEEITLREAVVTEKLVQESLGAYDGYALVRWPKAQYRRVLALQRARAERALQVFLQAESALSQRRMAEAKDRLREARVILGPARAETPLGHERFANSGLLWDALQTFEARFAEVEAARRRRVAVGLDCRARAAPVACPAKRVGRIRELVAARGLKVAATDLDPELARRIAHAHAPEVSDAVRAAGYVLAVTYDAELLGEENGFTFARCGARGVLYDTDAGEIVSVKDVAPKKGGHLHFEGAMDQGCKEAEAALVGWLGETMQSFAPPEGRR